jgi:hypothetical protein
LLVHLETEDTEKGLEANPEGPFRENRAPETKAFWLAKPAKVRFPDGLLGKEREANFN